MSMSRAFAIAAASTIIAALAQAQDAGSSAAPAAGEAPAAAATPAAKPSATAEVPATSPCTEDIEAFCKGIKPGEGDILRCLADKSGELSSACKERLDQLKKDFLASAADCEPDVQAFCATVPHTGGRLLQCLKRHEKEVSAPCRALQTKLKNTAHAPHAAVPAKSSEAAASSVAAAPAADPAAPATTPPEKK